MGAHVCAMVVRDSGHVCGMKHPACKHRWDKKEVKQPAVGQKQAAEVKRYLDYSDSVNQSGSYSRHQSHSRTIPTRASSAPRPPRDTTGCADTGAAQRVVVLTAPSCREEQRRAETDDECLLPQFVDIFAGKNRPMSRAMDWCGWTTSSFEKFPAE